MNLLYYYFVYFISELLIFILAFLSVYFVIKKESNLIQVVSTGILSAITAEGIKYFFPTERPDNPLLGFKEGGSFPSTHTSISFALAFSVFFVNRKEGLILLTLASFVALGRVLSGAHHPLDILGGIIVGVAWGYITSNFTYDINFKKRRK